MGIQRSVVVAVRIATLPFVLQSAEVMKRAVSHLEQFLDRVEGTTKGTVVLATVVAKTEAKAGQDFFPLTVDYIEKTYAAGKIPGGFFKREGRPTEKETLSSRQIDRPIRPLMHKQWTFETQVMATVVSSDQEHDADVLAH